MSNVRPTDLTDQAARDRIRTEFDRSMLVEAGAGSGKTHELATRMAAGVASGAYQIEQMAAVTFTRKAAAELRGRFQVALENQLRPRRSALGLAEGDSREPTSEVVTRIHHALSNIERFFAGTIHAFCARLLRERPVEAGVAPGFTELDDVEDALVREQSWRDYRSQAKATGDPDYLALLDADIKVKQLDKAFKTVCLYEDVDFPPGNAAAPDDAAGWQALETFWDELSRWLPNPIDPETSCETQKHAVRFERDWRFFTQTRRTPALLATLLAHWEFTPKIVQFRWSDNAAEKKRLNLLIPPMHQAFRDATVDPFLTAWRRHLYGVCVTVLTKARAVAEAERRRRNTLSFNDLLMRTADVLRSNADVRRALQQKYRWLFVDEFQDTDPIQAEIMFLLAGEEEPAGVRPCVAARRSDSVAGSNAGSDPSRDADWRTLPTRPGALFVVGDPKQSIYRFRRADIDIYNEVRARLAGPDGLGVVTLTSNFRSVPSLCQWANEVFDGPFPKEPTEHSPKFAPLAAVRDPNGARGLPLDEARGRQTPGIQGLFTLTIPEDSPDGDGDEAARIARFVQSEVAAKRRGYGDFLLLTRTKKGLQPFADAFEALEIPIEVSGGGGFSESPEVQQVALLLMALTDPQDSVALVGVLRGVFFGLSDRELFAFKQVGGWFSVFYEPSADLAEAPAKSGSRGAGAKADGGVANALTTLRRWHRWTRVLPAGAALERILDESGYLALAAASPGGVEAGDLLHAIDRVRAVVESGFTLAEAAGALASWSKLDDDGPEESAEIESLPLESGRRDVVRLMNIHKAKGLEAPVVFLADPTGGYAPRADVRIVRSPAGDGTRGANGGPRGFFEIVPESNSGSHRKLKPIAEPVGWDALQQEELAYIEAEHTRLLYVAATRAEDVLVISRWRKKRGTPAWQAFEAHLDRVHAPELPVPATVAPPQPMTMDLSAAAAGTAMRHAEALHAGAMRASWSAASVTADAKRFPRVTAGGLDDAAADPDGSDPTRVFTEDTPSRRADAGIAWGTLVHGLLEHAMRHASATREDLRRLAMWLTVENDEPGLRAVIEQAIDTVEAVKGAAFWTAANASPESHEEAPFAVREIADGLPKVVNGTVDLVYRAGDGWQIVDYKTDADVATADLAARYALQIEAYGRAWGKVSGAAVSSSVVAAREGPAAGQPRLFE